MPQLVAPKSFDPVIGKRKGFARAIVVDATVSGLLIGFDTAMINGALLFLRSQFHLTEHRII
jgi:hypothetical protein